MLRQENMQALRQSGLVIFLNPAAVLKPDRDNDTSVIRGPAIRKAGWLNSNGAVKHTAACEKSYISGVIRKSTEKPYFQKALPGAVSA